MITMAMAMAMAVAMTMTMTVTLINFISIYNGQFKHRKGAQLLHT